MCCDWSSVALIHILLGYEADILGIITFVGGDQRTQALLIVAFVLYTFGGILMTMTKFAEQTHNIALSIVIVFLLISAATLLCVGVGVYGQSNAGNPYAATLEISAAILAVLGSFFVVVRLAVRSSESP